MGLLVAVVLALALAPRVLADTPSFVPGMGVDVSTEARFDQLIVPGAIAISLALAFVIALRMGRARELLTAITALVLFGFGALFIVAGLFGDFSGAAFELGSPRLIAVAEKTAAGAAPERP